MEHSPEEIRILSRPEGHTFVKTWYDLSDESHFWMQWRVAAFLRQATAVNAPFKKSLTGMEVGCGCGVLRRQIEQITNWSIDGVELSLDPLKRTPKGRGKLFLYDITEKNKEFAGKYDFLFLYDVLEHVERTSTFLRACAYHMKNNGLLYINVPAFNALYSAYDTAAGHRRRYSIKSLSEELQDNQYKILDIRYWGFSLIPLLVLRKILTSPGQNRNAIIIKGFKPPSPSVHAILKSLMSVETALVRKPPLGTSVMAAAMKI